MSDALSGAQATRPLIIVRAGRDHDAAAVASAIPGQTIATIVDNGPIGVGGRLVGMLRDADCLVLALRRSHLQESASRIDLLLREFPVIPAVLVTEREPDVASMVSRVAFSAVLWFSDLSQTLATAVHEAGFEGSFRDITRSVEAADLPPTLRAGVAAALRRADRAPYRTVRAVAVDVGCSPITLSHQYHEVVGSPHTFGHFLSAVLIVRAVHRHASGRTWKTVSSELGLARDTLRRRARTWPGVSLREAGRLDPRELILRFVEDWIAELCAARGPRQESG